ncbi:zinc-binding dehydrogenase [Escherichia coli]|uniref:Zinc-binding dehydrogenase n=1 Tax=Escherichia coli TaxID=562 RepID=A0A376VVK2_ECOLX|nr:zinc-binding dehydrogenase [Escherichia coli]
MKTLICQQPGVMEYVEKDIPTPADNEVLGNAANLLI